MTEVTFLNIVVGSRLQMQVMLDDGQHEDHSSVIVRTTDPVTVTGLPGDQLMQITITHPSYHIVLDHQIFMDRHLDYQVVQRELGLGTVRERLGLEVLGLRVNADETGLEYLDFNEMPSGGLIPVDQYTSPPCRYPLEEVTTLQVPTGKRAIRL